ncbi:MAG: pectate lyase [Moraxellaceae bacterium]|nr:pectate lyase [Moraxellaceae bacterium]
MTAAMILGLVLGACSSTQEQAPVTRAAPPPGGYKAIPLEGFSDGIKHWRDRNGNDYAKYEPAQIVEIADNLLLYQRNNGGWVENRDPTRIVSLGDRAEFVAERVQPKGSFDNRNVYSQIEYLSAVYLQTKDERYRAAALKGLDYTLANQHRQCGGWPHTVPSDIPYHGYITMADEVTSGVLRMLRKVAEGSEPFGFMDAATRERARVALQKGDACVLKLQVVQNGQPAGWAGQYHPDTLQAAQGRSFELPAMVSQESVEMVRYLMGIPNPSPEVIRAIDGAMAWFDRSALRGWKIETVKLDKPVKYEFHTATTDRLLVQDPTAPLLWARFYDVKDNSVVLANRDGIRVTKYADITHERRTGYAWYGVWPAKLVAEEYPDWKKRMGR